MITPFSKPRHKSVVPSNRSLIGIWIVLIILIVFYIISLVSYLSLFFLGNTPLQDKILVAISVFEMIVTGSSIVISVIATKLSDAFSNACIERIEYFNKQNYPFHKHQELIDAANQVTRDFKVARRVKIAVIIAFGGYLIGSVIWYIFNRMVVLQLVTFILGAVSAIFSIVLALVSAISCVETGRYTDLLLNVLYEDFKDLVDKYNDLSISQKK